MTMLLFLTKTRKSLLSTMLISLWMMMTWRTLSLRTTTPNNMIVTSMVTLLSNALSSSRSLRWIVTTASSVNTKSLLALEATAISNKIQTSLLSSRRRLTTSSKKSSMTVVMMMKCMTKMTYISSKLITRTGPLMSRMTSVSRAEVNRRYGLSLLSARPPPRTIFLE